MQNGKVRIFAARKFTAGDPFYVSYGVNVSNQQLLLDRGVALPNNAHDIVPVRGHPDDDGLYGPQKLRMLQESGLAKDHVSPRV